MQHHNPVFIPGPTNIPDSIRNAMNVQTTDHRADDFADLLQPVLIDLKRVFKTQSAEIALFPASGTGGWEAAISNTLSPGDTVLIPRFGVFSTRWAQLCEHHRLNVEIIDCEWGTGAPVDLIAEVLVSDSERRIKAVLVTHNETATGVVSDIEAVRAAIDAASHPAIGSQKGLMLPVGLSILAISDKALLAAEQADGVRSFFDIKDMLANTAAGGYPYTPPVQLLNGLRCSLAMLFEEGLEPVFSRHFHIAEGVRRAIDAWGMPLCAQDPHLYSNSVSTIIVPDGFNSRELTQHLWQRYQMSFGAGLGQLAGRAFRIGHLGAMSEPMALSGLATVEMAMMDLDYPVQPGHGVAAAQNYYRNSRPAEQREAA